MDKELEAVLNKLYDLAKDPQVNEEKVRAAVVGVDKSDYTELFIGLAKRPVDHHAEYARDVEYWTAAAAGQPSHMADYCDNEVRVCARYHMSHANRPVDIGNRVRISKYLHKIQMTHS